MGLIPEITCRRCGFRYSGLKSRCPKCGAPRANQSTRAAATTASAMEGTASRARAEVNGRWQLIFAGILAAAVLLAVGVLAASGAGSGSPGSGVPATQPGAASGNQGGTAVTITNAYLPSPMPTPEPTPEGTPAPAITGMEIIFLDKAVKPDISMTNDGEMTMQLEARWFPADAPVTPVWSSSNEKILTVDQTGLVTIVGADPKSWIYATISVECEGLTAFTVVHVPNYQAQHLINNLYLQTDTAG